MVDTNNQENRKYNITDNEVMNNNYWINGILAWWSGFSLRTKLLAIATLVVSPVSYTHLTLPTICSV